MIDDELPATIEEGFEMLFAFRAIKDIVLFDLHHGQPPSLSTHAIMLFGERLFMRQKFLPLRVPLGLRRSWRMSDCAFSHLNFIRIVKAIYCLRDGKTFLASIPMNLRLDPMFFYGVFHPWSTRIVHHPFENLRVGLAGNSGRIHSKEAGVNEDD
jgi:hypothetical protein